jgi:hypothetical protein
LSGTKSIQRLRHLFGSLVGGIGHKKQSARTKVNLSVNVYSTLEERERAAAAAAAREYSMKLLFVAIARKDLEMDHQCF